VSSSLGNWPSPTVSEEKDQYTAWEDLAKQDNGSRLLRRIASLHLSGQLHPGRRNLNGKSQGCWPTPTTAEAGKISCQPNYGQVGLSNHPAIMGKAKRGKQKKSFKDVLEPDRAARPVTKGKLNPSWVEQLMLGRHGVGWTRLPTHWQTEPIVSGSLGTEYDNGTKQFRQNNPATTLGTAVPLWLGNKVRRGRI